MYVKHKSGFIGNRHVGLELEFYNTDSMDTFEHNLANKPENWYYRDHKITYKFNSNGHRNDIEISDLDSDYILFSGCSFTTGVGLNKEDSYVHLLSKQLNLKYYNLALPASGWDLVYYNIKHWFSIDDIRLPKYVIIQWPSFYRYGYLDKNNSWACYHPNFSEKEEEMWFTMLNDDFKNKQLNYRKDIANLLSKKNITLFEITPCNEPVMAYEGCSKLMMCGDSARDNHPGKLTHKAWAATVFFDIYNRNNVS